MRHVRRLPPVLRVANIAGWLFLLADFALLINYFVILLSSSSQAYPDSTREWLITINLIWLSLVCTVVAGAYPTRVGQPGLGPFRLDSWQSQVRTILLLWALPLGGIAWVLILPPTSAAFWIVYAISLLATIVMFAAFIAVTVGMVGTGPMRTPPTWSSE